MRGECLAVALGAIVSLAIQSAPVAAADIESVARQKAAAVALVRSKAEHFAATISRGRLFSAYLNASTVSEGDRVRSRLGQTFAALQNQYGMKTFSVVDRTGDLFVHVGTGQPAPRRISAAEADGDGVAMAIGEETITFVSPVMRRGEKEFVLSIEQELSAYDRVLARGLAKPFYVVVVDAAGRILSDSRPSQAQGEGGIAAGLNLADLRRELGGGAEATGRLTREGRNFNISYQTVGGWTVVAVETLSAAEPCLRTGEKTCP